MLEFVLTITFRHQCLYNLIYCWNYPIVLAWKHGQVYQEIWRANKKPHIHLLDFVQYHIGGPFHISNLSASKTIYSNVHIFFIALFLSRTSYACENCTASHATHIYAARRTFTLTSTGLLLRQFGNEHISIRRVFARPPDNHVGCCESILSQSVRIFRNMVPHFLNTLLCVLYVCVFQFCFILCFFIFVCV